MLRRRFLFVGGPRFRIYENIDLGIYIAHLVMYEHELLDDEARSRDDRFKGDLYVSITYSLDKRVNFTLTTYYQLRLGYSYSFDLGPVGRYANGSHEIMLNYVFRYKKDLRGSRHFGLN